MRCSGNLHNGVKLGIHAGHGPEGYTPAPRSMWRAAILRESCDRSVEACQWVDSLNREVRAQSDASTVVEDASERIQSLDTLRTLRLAQ